MLTLYIANKNYSSWSLRPWALMRELGIPFTEKLMPFGPPGAFRSFSPSGKVPCLVDGDTVVWDSLAIVEYLFEGHPHVWPTDVRARAWARSAAAEMHSGFSTMRTIFGMNCGLRVKVDPLPPALLEDLARLQELWTDGLARFGGPFLAGKAFSGVDAFFAPVAFRIQTYSPPLGKQAQEYVQRLLALPSMQAWYRDGLAETWRDEPHDAEAREFGKILADLRATPG